jgi:DNA-directed RNA polymerase specialized sigma24 family protein
MVDPWHVAIVMLLGTYAVPNVPWPEGRRHVVEAAGWLQDLPDVEPEPRTASADEALLAFLRDAGAVSVRQMAGALAIPKSTVARGLQRLRAAGRAELEPGGGWSARY